MFRISAVTERHTPVRVASSESYYQAHWRAYESFRSHKLRTGICWNFGADSNLDLKLDHRLSTFSVVINQVLGYEVTREPEGDQNLDAWLQFVGVLTKSYRGRCFGSLSCDRAVPGWIAAPSLPLARHPRGTIEPHEPFFLHRSLLWCHRSALRRGTTPWIQVYVDAASWLLLVAVNVLSRCRPFIRAIPTPVTL